MPRKILKIIWWLECKLFKKHWWVQGPTGHGCMFCSAHHKYGSNVVTYDKQENADA